MALALTLGETSSAEPVVVGRSPKKIGGAFAQERQSLVERIKSFVPGFDPPEGVSTSELEKCLQGCVDGEY